MANNMLIDSILKRQLRDYFMRHPSQYDEFRAIILNKKENRTVHQKGNQRRSLPTYFRAYEASSL